jgi:probable addiction module antidote protein
MGERNPHKLRILRQPRSLGKTIRSARRKMRRNLDYKADLLADLRDNPRFAADYLSAAYVDSREAFLVALRDVAEAQKGIAKVAAGAKVNRENLYRMLSKEGNPRLSTLGSVLNALGMDLSVTPKQSSGR